MNWVNFTRVEPQGILAEDEEADRGKSKDILAVPPSIVLTSQQIFSSAAFHIKIAVLQM